MLRLRACKPVRREKEMKKVLLVKYFRDNVEDLAEEAVKESLVEHIRYVLRREGAYDNYDRVCLVEVKQAPESISDGEYKEIRRQLELAEEDELEVLFVRCEKQPPFPREVMLAAMMGLLISGPPTKEDLGCGNASCPVHGPAVVADRLFQELEEDDEGRHSDFLN